MLHDYISVSVQMTQSEITRKITTMTLSHWLTMYVYTGSNKGTKNLVKLYGNKVWQSLHQTSKHLNETDVSQFHNNKTYHPHWHTPPHTCMQTSTCAQYYYYYIHREKNMPEGWRQKFKSFYERDSLSASV